MLKKLCGYNCPQQTWDNQTKYLFEEEYDMLRIPKSKPLFVPASLDLNPV